MAISNRKFWKRNISTNTLRNKRVCEELADQGWRILIVGECTIKGQIAIEHLDEVMDEIAIWIQQPSDNHRWIASEIGLTF